MGPSSPNYLEEFSTAATAMLCSQETVYICFHDICNLLPANEPVFHFPPILGQLARLLYMACGFGKDSTRTARQYPEGSVWHLDACTNLTPVR